MSETWSSKWSSASCSAAAGSARGSAASSRASAASSHEPHVSSAEYRLAHTPWHFTHLHHNVPLIEALLGTFYSE